MKEINAERVWKTKVGLTAVVVQVMRGERDGKPVKSHYCGYVGVPKDHALYEVPYDGLNISVHGGLTYASLSDCYPVENSDNWWFGFDCAHSGDAHHEEFYEYMRSLCSESPILWQPHPGSVFRTLEYCVNECEQLAEQLDAFVRLIEE